MRKNFILSALFVSIGLYTAAQQNEGSNVVVATDGDKTEIPETAQMLQVAGQLTKYGYAQEEALPLIQAVEIYQNYAGSSSKTGEKNASVDNVSEPTDTKTGNLSFSTEKLLADATTFADGDETYVALIERLQNNTTRGATKNYSAHYDRVQAHSTDTYSIRFYGNELACVIVSGDGDTDLDVYVYDHNGNLVASDTDYSDDCVVAWTPRWTGNFTIKIKNRGRVYNNYVMTVN